MKNLIFLATAIMGVSGCAVHYVPPSVPVMHSHTQVHTHRVPMYSCAHGHAVYAGYRACSHGHYAYSAYGYQRYVQSMYIPRYPVYTGLPTTQSTSVYAQPQRQEIVITLRIDDDDD
jgi:hypothetical protein